MQDIILIITVSICLITDLINRKIYNIVVFPASAAGLIVNAITNGWTGVQDSVFGFFAGVLFLILPFAYGGIGAGDVKLIAAIGAIKGWVFVLYTFLGTGIVGGIIAVLILIYKGKLVNTLHVLFKGLYIMILSRFKIMSFSADNESYMFPYGVAIAIGTVLTYGILR